MVDMKWITSSIWNKNGIITWQFFFFIGLQNILPVATLWHGWSLTMKYKRMQSLDYLLFTEVIN